MSQMFRTKAPVRNNSEKTSQKSSSKSNTSKINYEKRLEEIDTLKEIVEDLTQKIAELSFDSKNKIDILSPYQLSKVIEGKCHSLVGLNYKEVSEKLKELLKNKKIKTEEAYFYKRFTKDPRSINQYYELIKNAEYKELFEKIR